MTVFAPEVCGLTGKAGNATIHPTASINVEDFSVGEGTVIEAGVRINGRKVHIGRNVTISEGVRIGGFQRKELARLTIGDDVLLGERVQIALPEAAIGDYVKIHRQCSLYGQERLAIGHNAWCGETSILNCSGGLYVGNNVGIATRNGIWTHIAHGEVVEGSTLRSFTPTILWHNAWLLPDVTVSSGVEVGEFSVVLANSVVTKSTEPYHLYAGTPASDITDRKRPYDPTSPERRLELMTEFIEEFLRSAHPNASREDDTQSTTWTVDERTSIAVIKIPSCDARDLKRLPEGSLVFGYALRDFPPEWAYFDLKEKTYEKHYTTLERSLMSFLISGLARFVPARNPVLEKEFLAECVSRIRRG